MPWKKSFLIGRAEGLPEQVFNASHILLAAGVAELQDIFAAVLVNPLRHLLPKADLVIVINRRVANQNSTPDSNRRKGRDDRPDPTPGKFLFPVQSGVAAMAVVVVEHPRDAGPQQPVFDFKIPEPKRLEDDLIFHGRPPPSFTTAPSARLQENAPPLSLKHPRE